MDQRVSQDELTGTATVFVLGIVVGAAAAALMGSEHRKVLADKARRKLDEFTRGRTIEDVSGSVRKGVREVLTDINQAGKMAAVEGRREARQLTKRSDG